MHTTKIHDTTSTLFVPKHYIHNHHYQNKHEHAITMIYF